LSFLCVEQPRTITAVRRAVFTRRTAADNYGCSTRHFCASNSRRQLRLFDAPFLRVEQLRKWQSCNTAVVSLIHTLISSIGIPMNEN
jgi:hypothetical protein